MAYFGLCGFARVFARTPKSESKPLRWPPGPEQETTAATAKGTKDRTQNVADRPH